MATLQFCTFYLAGLLFGVELKHVQEVLRSLKITPVPLAPKSICGLINLRGQIVPALDLCHRLHIDICFSEMRPMNVVVRTSEGLLSLLVDEVGDVVEVNDDLLERLPLTVPAATNGLITGFYKLEQCLMHVLDIERVCEGLEPNRPTDQLSVEPVSQ